FSLICCTVFGQEFVSLRSVPFTTFNELNIHVEAVIDERVVKNLGNYKNINGALTELAFLSGAENSIKEFFSHTFSKNRLSDAIIIKIRSLNLQSSKRRMNDGVVAVARTHIELVFCKKENDELKELYSIKHNEDGVFSLYDKQGLQATHEERIRAALEYCMHRFMEKYPQLKESVETMANFEMLKENKDTEVRLGQWVNLVTAKGMQSRYFQGYGITYTGFVDSKKGLIRPYELSFEVTWARDEAAAENGYLDINSFVFRPELYFIYKRLFKGVYATTSANIPLGYELLEDLEGDNSFNFVVGVGASQGLRIIPWQRKGIAIGADFFQQFETSKVYRFDYGIEIVLGVNF
ncbi:MAG: hypothetical protein AAGJ18_22750, partial [Bacteroidota bacterium]